MGAIHFVALSAVYYLTSLLIMYYGDPFYSNMSDFSNLDSRGMNTLFFTGELELDNASTCRTSTTLHK
jgi:hypothetical protein